MKKLFVIVGLCFCGPAFSQWYVTTVDTTRNSGIYGTSIALDSLDIPHIAYSQYGNKGLMYASWNPADSSWILEDVPIEGKIAGTDASLKLDSLDYPHISFWEGSLGYIWKDAGGWHKERPDLSGIDGTCLALDSKDRPHIAYPIYFNNDSSLVAYIYKDETGWYRTIIDTVGHTGTVSIVLDKKDCPHIAYGGRPNPFDTAAYRRPLIYATRIDGIWYRELVDSNVFNGTIQASIALDSLENPCIAYDGMHRDSIEGWKWDERYAQKEGGQWKTEQVEEVKSPNSYGENCLQIDKDNNPHISYKGDVWLKYAWRNGNQWYIDNIDSVMDEMGRYVSYTGLALDRNNYAHISYYNHIEGVHMKYTKGYAIGIDENSKLKTQS